MSDRWIVIPRWDDFQHRDAVRSRQPTWIKNYVALLHKDEYLDLTHAQRGVLHALWLMFAQSRSEGVRESVASRMLQQSASDARYFRGHLAALEQAGFIAFSASNPASKVASEYASLEEKRREASSNNSLTYTSTPPRGNGWIDDLNVYTGCRLVRGEIGSAHVYDPLGTERPPFNWPHERPTRAEIRKALEERAHA
jgi:hypothetical protein